MPVPPKLRDLSDLSTHHIFPKKLLIDAFGKDAKIKVTVNGRGVEMDETYNHVGNITFISAERNVSIRETLISAEKLTNFHMPNS
ncbi:MAG: hypothetical protein QXO76_01850 [Thermoproteota archaeon]